MRRADPALEARAGATVDQDPIRLAVMANRMEAIVREMADTIVRTARSSVIGMARDMSCSIVTPEGELVAAAEGVPIHIYAATLQARALVRLHPNPREGDAFLHNDPYDGGTHPADHAVLVPVFHERAHVFTVIVTCHQADIGNSIPTTYMAPAKDVYEEGALIFPCVAVQRAYREVDDVIRMCRRRIRVPEQWYGDHLAAIGAARIGEQRLKDFIAAEDMETMRRFVAAWFDYTERRTVNAIKKVVSGRVTVEGGHDPVEPFLPDGIPITVTLEVDAGAGEITVDLRDNIDCVDAGMNLTEATATMAAAQGVFNCLEDVPYNSGTFRHVRVLLRENCVAGIPRFPHSCSCATAPMIDILINLVHLAFAKLGDELGISQGNWVNSAGAGVISGRDSRRGGAPYVSQVYLMGGGGPATATTDGMASMILMPVMGLLYRDSVEIDEQRFPILVESLGVIEDSAGAGRFRGGPGTEVVFGPRADPMTVINITNGVIARRPLGVHGGHDAKLGANVLIRENGGEELQPAYINAILQPGERIRAIDQGGGGFGDPTARDSVRVKRDIVERIVSVAQAREVYGVVVTGEAATDGLKVDEAATAARRAELRGAAASAKDDHEDKTR